MIEIHYLRIGELVVDSCPFWRYKTIEGLEDNSHCKINKVSCRYGLTEIRVPEHCPLKKRDITLGVKVGKMENHGDEIEWEE